MGGHDASRRIANRRGAAIVAERSGGRERPGWRDSLDSDRAATRTPIADEPGRLRSSAKALRQRPKALRQRKDAAADAASSG